VRWTQSLIPTMKESPEGAEIPSHVHMLRAGLIGQVMAGSYTYLPLGLRALRKADPKFDLAHLDRTEGPVWRLVTERPPHLLDPKYATWDAMLLATLDATIDGLAPGKASLADCTWGTYNRTKSQHPLSRAISQLSRWLDMPSEPLPGDTANMPRIQGPSVGASQRMAVAPGHEDQGYFHMPCGQCGHPWSPHYADGHPAWVHGVRTPFLPGPTIHVLVLYPADASP
jgi:penicillin G amidase